MSIINNFKPKPLQSSRRKWLKSSVAFGASLGISPFTALQSFAEVTELEPTAKDYVTGYNNFYEFSLQKEDVQKRAQDFTTAPWTVEIAGDFAKTGQFDLADLLQDLPIYERTYRLRCVEAWSMVVPWQGVRLVDLLDKLGVNDEAKYIAFESVFRPEDMPGQRQATLPWPYKEGLRIDEARHDLTLLATGIFGEPLPPQNGAPIRLVVPWKYGFKSIKSIAKISTSQSEPPSTWHEVNAREYGFYANVNPQVNHPRWSQASERIIGAGLLGGRKDTLKFNGYDEVASLYEGMDLAKFY